MPIVTGLAARCVACSRIRALETIVGELIMAAVSSDHRRAPSRSSVSARQIRPDSCSTEPRAHTGGRAASLRMAAAASFLTPVATPANLMIMEPGGYRLGDYWKLGLPLLGLPLLALFGVVAVLLVPVIWSF